MNVLKMHSTRFKPPIHYVIREAEKKVRDWFAKFQSGIADVKDARRPRHLTRPIEVDDVKIDF